MIIRRKDKMSKLRFCFLFFLFLMVGCRNYTQTGDIPSDTRINAIKIGKHKKEDVSRLLGSPTSISLFEKEMSLED